MLLLQHPERASPTSGLLQQTALSRVGISPGCAGPHRAVGRSAPRALRRGPLVGDAPTPAPGKSTAHKWAPTTSGALEGRDLTWLRRTTSCRWPQRTTRSS